MLIGEEPTTKTSGASKPAAVCVPNLLLSRFLLGYQVQEAIRFPEYSGSVWRGAFGHTLKSIVCVTKQPACSGCILFRSCVYAYVFETPPPRDSAKMKRYNGVPHPFV